jgi:hypothetical protein
MYVCGDLRVSCDDDEWNEVCFILNPFQVHPLDPLFKTRRMITDRSRTKRPFDCVFQITDICSSVRDRDAPSSRVLVIL